MRSRLSPTVLRRGVFIAAAIIFVVRLTYFLFFDLADGRSGHVPERFFNEITGGVLALVPLAGIAWLARRRPLAPPITRGTIASYVAAFVLFSTVHTALMLIVRAALGPLFGFDGYDLGVALTFARFAYEGANDFIVGVAVVVSIALAESLLAQRERERSAAALEGALLRAELSNLRLQLQPHFLFNALNTISSRMYEDVDSADALLGRLADLLRTSLRTTHTQEVPVRDELAVLTQYLELMRARFGEALDVCVEAAPDVQALLVPSMVLQPLVENAVRHGGVSRVGRGQVWVTLRRDARTLTIRVQDVIPAEAGIHLPVRDEMDSRPHGNDGNGTGLSATARRLQLLYGDAQSMHAGPTPNGWDVTLRIPARSAP